LTARYTDDGAGRLPIQRWTDIAAPIDRVLNVDKKDRNKVSWKQR
jgi:hypothetical protein